MTCIQLFHYNAFAKQNWRKDDKYNVVIDQLQESINANRKLVKIQDSSNTSNGSASNNSALSLLSDTLKSLQRDNLSGHDRYISFLLKFRKAYRSADATTQPLLEDLAGFLFTGVDITTFNSALVCKIAEKGGAFKNWTKPTGLEFSKMVNNLDRYSSGIAKAGYNAEIGQTLKGEWNLAALDPNTQGNLISVKAKYLGPRGIHYAIRMPSQTINSRKDNTEITPEFLAYLAFLKRRNLKHTYINLQNINDHSAKLSNLISDERWRGRKIQELSLEKKNLIVITLNKQSDFYKQSGKKPKTFEEFKKDILTTLVPTDSEKWKISGIRLDDLWNPQKFTDISRNSTTAKRDFRNTLSQMIDTLGNTVFGYSKRRGNLNEMISSGDRQSLIELLYNAISDYASRESFSSNRTCKDGIDRGGGANAMTYFASALKASCDPNRESNLRAEDIPGILFSDALETRKRAIKRERLEYFQNAATKLLQVVHRENGCEILTDPNGLGGLIRLNYPQIDRSDEIQSRVTDALFSGSADSDSCSNYKFLNYQNMIETMSSKRVENGNLSDIPNNKNRRVSLKSNRKSNEFIPSPPTIEGLSSSANSAK